MDQDFVRSALLRHNFFPAQKEKRDEVPPCFTSDAFAPEVAQALTSLAHPKRKIGYDSVEYRLTRFNNVSRDLSIPHPTAYARLALDIAENWDGIAHICSNKNSEIRPREHSDGRLIIMDYETSFAQRQRDLADSSGMRFVVKTDITNCFPSIYSHSLSWALVGTSVAKATSSDHDKWYNRLDKSVRMCRRNERNGVSIGPTTSNIISEIILGQVDNSISQHFKFRRYIDDFTAYCASENDAQEFVRRLAAELRVYKLQLNTRKTKIIQLPTSLIPSWIIELSAVEPPPGKVGYHRAQIYLNKAISLSQAEPDGSVLKYALSMLCSRELDPAAGSYVLQHGLILSYHYPALLPTLRPVVQYGDYGFGGFKFVRELSDVAKENACHCRSDGMCWALYYMALAGVKPDDALVDAVIQSGDCLAIAMLYVVFSDIAVPRVRAFVQQLTASDIHEIDRYWLLLYEMYRRGDAVDPYNDDPTFECLRAHDVGFVHPIDCVIPQFDFIKLLSHQSLQA